MRSIRMVAMIFVGTAVLACGPRGDRDLSDIDRQNIADTVTGYTRLIVDAWEQGDNGRLFGFFEYDSSAALATDGRVWFIGTIREREYADIFTELLGRQVRLDSSVVTVVSADAAIFVAQGMVRSREADAAPARRLALSLVWVRREGGWAVSHSHVSLAPNATGG